MKNGLFTVQSELYLAASNPYLPHMKHMLAALVAAVTFQLSTAPLAHAQTATYIGPRYSGGPDSLRALMYRCTRLAASAPAGRMAVEFELLNGQKPRNFKLLSGSASANAELVKAGATTLAYLQAHMLDWQAGVTDKRSVLSGQNPKLALVLEFSPSSISSRPYAYADQNPVLSAPVVPGRGRSRPTPNYSTPDLVGQIQRQTRYPGKALQEMRMGVVYVAFEVAENRAIERPEVLGTVSPELDAETLLVVSSLPPATAPALLRDRPVRVAYVLPITFRIQ